MTQQPLTRQTRPARLGWVTTVNVQEAKAQLSRLLSQVEQGQEVTIARAGQPVARLVPVNPPVGRRFGVMSFEVPGDFDAPLSEQDLAQWE